MCRILSDLSDHCRIMSDMSDVIWKTALEPDFGSVNTYRSVVLVRIASTHQAWSLCRVPVYILGDLGWCRMCCRILSDVSDLSELAAQVDFLKNKVS